MNKYKIFETDNFLRNIEKNRGENKTLIKKILLVKIYLQLRIQPYYGKNIKELKNYTPETWRYRIGNFRLFYEI
ncbi:MAG: type II toxin-antitoxin system RelE/ParE family toxin [Spirochaetes bacterium]|nr:type II toxin-antitoxin system RelE/ParE family toxin [Spirochaetota bacterium]